jgi:hypothetical protein
MRGRILCLRMKLRFVLTLAFLLFAQLASADSYVRSLEFKPIHIERNELLKTATDILLYVRKINGESARPGGHIRLGGEGYSTSLGLPLGQNDYDKFPRVAYDGVLEIEGNGGPIWDVELRLSDYARTLTVRGSSHDDVTGLLRVVEEKLAPHEVFLGGITIRFFLVIVSMIFFIAALFLAGQLDKLRDWGIVTILCIIAYPVLAFVPPWAHIFPGFLADTEGRPFLERNAALFTFVGLAIMVLAPVASFVRTRLRKKAGKDAPKDNAAHPAKPGAS